MHGTVKPHLRPELDRRRLARSVVGFSAAMWAWQWLLMDGAQLMNSPIPELDSYSWRLAWVSGGAVVCAVVWRLTRRFHEETFWKLATIFLGLFLVFGAIASVLLQLLFFQIGDNWPADDILVARVYGNTRFWLHFYLAWAAILLALIYSARVRHEEARRLNAQSTAQHAEIQAFRYQIHPQFLSNTFNSIDRRIAEGEHRKSAEMIGDLSSFLRHSLAPDAYGDIPLAQEIEFELEYLELERMRFPDNLQLRVEFAEGLDARRVQLPGFILQPLVENAIRHGAESTSGTTRITLSARTEDFRLKIAITNEVLSGADAPNYRHDHGSGLQYVAARLTSRFGADFTLEAKPVRPGKYTASIDIPLIEDSQT